MTGFLGLGGSPAPNLNLPAPWNATSAQDRWGQIYNQIQAEGAQQGASATDIQGQIAAAQTQFTTQLTQMVDNTSGGALSQAGGIVSSAGQSISTIRGIAGAQLGSIGSNFEAMAASVQQNVVAQNTIYGAVQIVQSAVTGFQELQQGISSGNPAEIEAGLQVFTGILVSTLILSGVAPGIGTAVGAAVGAAIEIGVAVLEAFHIIGTTTGTKVGDGTCSGQGFTSAQGTTGGVIALPALTWGLLSPGTNGEGVCVWGSLIQPGSSLWRKFPDPNNANGTDDSAWFVLPTIADAGLTFTWPPGLGQAKWFTQNSGNWRPIDNAFHRYRWLESEAQLSYELTNGGGEGVSLTSLDPDTFAAVVGFLQAYFRLWKKNAELALNGLTPAADAQVLGQLVNAWNTAHAPGKTFTFKPYSGCTNSYNCFPPGSAGQGADPEEVTGGYSYVSLLVSDLVLAGVAATSGLVINTGPQYNPPLALVNPSMSTAKKVALATGAVVAVGAAGAAGYGLYTGQGAGFAFGVAGDALKGLYGDVAGRLGMEKGRRRPRRPKMG